ncbi:dTDP-4-amino-4,6-dideoxygalactose transaminase [Lacibacter cauensis]|uniref:dTDP-4-amino-4,6-dideoxygalactose transaminase n=1 Tax=Lacibacter cauensis TaxID=510947 RepID=A0A562SJZ5_9BACT|nr:dTDP-4-amino-4,6-dideoxygalactose transaminase [Lacibacter cauensis]TWI81423.1 dTDP-4-amino-4,6-dideoxygalactose transaminase [Lacibacter cauensis]
MILLSKPAFTAGDEQYIQEALQQLQQGRFNEAVIACENWFNKRYQSNVFLTPSCTAALEMAALILQLQPGDEVIVPSYTYVGTVTPFAKAGATLRFADSTATHPNVAIDSIRQKITARTKAIVVVHYGGVACDMDALLPLATETGIPVIEDAAHCIGAQYKSRYLGTLGDLGTLSFGSQKNISCLQGGALFINRQELTTAAEIVRYNGTNKAAFLRRETSSFSWTGQGGNYLPSEIGAALLYSQLQRADSINEQRLRLWEHYFHALQPLAEKGLLQLPVIPAYARHNAHIFYVLTADKEQQSRMIAFLQQQQIQAMFHYPALHQSPFAHKRYSAVCLPHADAFEQRLVRLPLHTQLSSEEQQQVITAIYSFFGERY